VLNDSKESKRSFFFINAAFAVVREEEEREEDDDRDDDRDGRVATGSTGELESESDDVAGETDEAEGAAIVAEVACNDADNLFPSSPTGFPEISSDSISSGSTGESLRAVV
jgi:hypothetical protein